MKKVFIDCGANDGCSIDLFRKLYPDADQYEIHSFEPNPLFREKLKNKNVNFYEMAVSVSDDRYIFYLDPIFVDDEYKYFGSSLVEDKVKNKCQQHKCAYQKIDVQGIDFSKWILDNFDQNDYIVLKMDIEGAEYGVLDKMIKDGSLDYINVIYIEFHGHKIFDNGVIILNGKEIRANELDKMYLNEMIRRNVKVFDGPGKWNTVKNILII